MHRIATGQKHHRLTAIRPQGSKNACRLWLWRCECRTEKIIATTLVVRGLVQSCGCLRDDALREKGITHGASKTREYRIWLGMKSRCYSKTDYSFNRYGGRGITVCERWRASLSAFMEDMGPIPSETHSLDRIDNNGPYEPDNCRWATMTEQARNKRNNHMLTFKGQTKPLGTWAKELGIPRLCIRQRLLKLGWSVDRALSEPRQDWTKSIRKVAEAHGLKRSTVQARLKKGWSMHRALHTPV